MALQVSSIMNELEEWIATRDRLTGEVLDLFRQQDELREKLDSVGLGPIGFTFDAVMEVAHDEYQRIKVLPEEAFVAP